MKRILGLLCILFIFSTTAPYTSERAVTLHLPWLHQFQFAGYYAALEQGFYKDAGFTVTLKEEKPGLSSIHEVTNGNAEYGVSRSELLGMTCHSLFRGEKDPCSGCPSLD